MIKFHCPQCQAKIGVDEKHAGRRVKCPKCSAAVSVPIQTNDSASPPGGRGGGVDLFAAALQAENTAKPPPRTPEAEPATMPLTFPTPHPAAPPRAPVKPKREAERRQKFALQWWCGPIAMVVVIVPVATHYSQLHGDGALVANQIGQIVGEIVGAFIVGLFIAWLIFLMTRGSRFAASLTFGIVAMMAVLGAGEAQRKHAENEAARQEMVAELNKDKAAFDKEPKNFDARLKYLNKVAGTVDKTSERLSGEDKIVAQGSAEMLRWMGAAAQPYNDALKRLEQAGGIKPATLSSREAIIERLQMVKDLSDANEKFDAAIKDIGPHYRAILDKTGLSESSKETAAKAFTSAPVYAYLPQIRETDRELTAAMTGMLNIMLSEWGEWRMNESGQVSFQSNAAATRYNEQFQKLQKAAQAQASLQKQAGVH